MADTYRGPVVGDGNNYRISDQHVLLVLIFHSQDRTLEDIDLKRLRLCGSHCLQAAEESTVRLHQLDCSSCGRVSSHRCVAITCCEGSEETRCNVQNCALPTITPLCTSARKAALSCSTKGHTGCTSEGSYIFVAKKVV